MTRSSRNPPAGVSELVASTYTWWWEAGVEVQRTAPAGVQQDQLASNSQERSGRSPVAGALREALPRVAEEQTRAAGEPPKAARREVGSKQQSAAKELQVRCERLPKKGCWTSLRAACEPLQDAARSSQGAARSCDEQQNAAEEVAGGQNAVCAIAYVQLGLSAAEGLFRGGWVSPRAAIAQQEREPAAEKLPGAAGMWRRLQRAAARSSRRALRVPLRAKRQWMGPRA